MEEQACKSGFLSFLLSVCVVLPSRGVIRTLLLAGPGVLDHGLVLISPLPGEIIRSDEGGFYQHVGGGENYFHNVSDSEINQVSALMRGQFQVDDVEEVVFGELWTSAAQLADSHPFVFVFLLREGSPAQRSTTRLAA